MSVREEISEYIKNGMRAGHSVESLRKALYDAGWHAYDVEEAIKEAVGAHGFSRLAGGKKEGIWEKMKHVLSNPSTFYESVRGEEGISDAFRYFLVISILPALVSALLMAVEMSMMGSVFGQGLGVSDNIASGFTLMAMVMSILSFPLYYIMGIIGVFFATGLLHVGVKIFGGKGEVGQSFKALVYGGMTPGFFASIPTAGLMLLTYVLPLEMKIISFLATIPFYAIFGIWAFYLETKGISILHNVSMLRAFVMVVAIPLIIFCAVALLIFSLMAAVAVVNPSTFTGARAVGFSELGAPMLGGWTFHAAETDEQFQAALKNNLPYRIEVTDISVTSGGSECTTTGGTGVYEIGSQFTVTARCGPEDAGSQYDIRLDITYDNLGTGTSGLTDSGVLTGTVS